jgi:hypothetical protein
MRSTLEGLLAYLGEALAVPAYHSAPQQRPDAYVLVDPVGGTPSLDAQHNDYALQAWATTYDGAEALVRECCDAMRAYGATPYAVPVPLGFDGRHYWWQVTFTVHALW